MRLSDGPEAVVNRYGCASMSVTAIILAAGKGTRMKSDKPKVLHEVCGRPMLAYVFDACRNAGCDRLIGVIGHGSERVQDAFADATDIQWVEQTEQLGTGHAVMVAGELLEKISGPVLVLAGDGPLLRGETLKKLLNEHRSNSAACTLATAIMPEPGAYGRILRDEQGALAGIVEYLDATEPQRQIQEVNISLYCFDAQRLREVLGRLSNNNAKGEYYLTDALGLLRSAGHDLAAVPVVNAEEVMSINDREHLAVVNSIMQRRIQVRHMRAGVTIDQPESTWIDGRAQIGPDTVLRPGSVLDGPCRIGRGCTVGPLVHLRDAVVPDGQSVEPANG